MAAPELAIGAKTKKDSPQSHRDHREEPGGRDMESDGNQVTQAVIGAAIEVHKALGPGLLESAYEQCLCRDLELRGVSFQRQRPVPLEYKGIELKCGDSRRPAGRDVGRRRDQGGHQDRAGPRGSTPDVYETGPLEAGIAHQLQRPTSQGRNPKTGPLNLLRLLLCDLCDSVVVPLLGGTREPARPQSPRSLWYARPSLAVLSD